MNYPDIDLRFSNDTGHWLLLRTFVGAGSLTVNLYGTPVHRRVESTTEPLVETGPVPVKETDDPTLEKGKRVTDEFGAPPRETSVHRLVYDADGKLLYDNTWRSYYVGEPSLVRVGTKEPPKKPVKPKKPVAGETADDDDAGDDDAPGRRQIRPSRPRLSRSDRLDEPRRHARRLARRGVDGRVERLGGRDELAVSLDPVLVAEARSADVDAAEVDREDVVEDGRGAIVDPHAGRQRLDSLRLDRAVAARVIGEVRDASHLEPDDVRRVVGDALGVGLGEAHADVVGAPESLRHSATIRRPRFRRAGGGMTRACHKRPKPQRTTAT